MEENQKIAPRGKRQKNIKKKSRIRTLAKLERIWKRGRKIEPGDVAALVANLASTLATLYSVVMELKRKWNKNQKPQPKRKPKISRNRTGEKPKPKRPLSHKQKPKHDHSDSPRSSPHHLHGRSTNRETQQITPPGMTG